MMQTFDFDNTLTITEFNEDFGMVFKEDRVSVVKILKAALPDAAIVTSRHDTSQSREEIAAFLKRNGISECGVHFTNGALKASILEALESQVHFDDDSEELIDFNPAILCLFGEQENWISSNRTVGVLVR